jgi:hypothetical protein
MTVGPMRRPLRRHAPRMNMPTMGSAAVPHAGKRRGATDRPESNKINTDILVGKYVVCPIAKPQADGGYTATVSIGTGRGNAAHARVMRFAPLFETSEAALRYATSEGLNWARQQPAWSTSRAPTARGTAGLSFA